MFDESTPQISYPPCTSVCMVEQCVDVEIVDDLDVEGEHMFQLAITNVSLGSISDSLSSTVVVIQDNIGGSFKV